MSLNHSDQVLGMAFSSHSQTLTVMHPVCVSSTGFTQPREP